MRLCYQTGVPTVTRSRYFVPSAMAIIDMGIFLTARIAIFVFHRNDFTDLGARDTLYAFFRGMLFDGSISVMYMGLPLLVMGLPFDWAVSRRCRRICGWYVFVVVVVFSFVLGGDAVYFGHVHRHAGSETWAVGQDLVILVAAALDEARLPLVLTVCALVGLGYGWHHLLKLPAQAVGRKWPHAVAWLVIFAAFFLTMRGGVSHKPLHIVNAFEGVPVSAGYLILNGPFSLNHSLRESYAVKVRPYPPGEAVREVRSLVRSERDSFLDEKFPLLRTRTVPASAARLGQPNVVIVLLESWDAEQIDGMRKAMGVAPRGATPNFDQFAARGALFTRFYASGQRSVQGIAAILAGIPPIPGMPLIGMGLEQNRLAYLGAIAQRYGYSTYFLQAGRRASYRCDAIAALSGFDHYYGEQDIPLSDHAGARHLMGAWDYDLFMKADEVFAAAPKPFMGFVFTLSTHGPYQLPAERWKRYPRELPESAYLNALAYSDWALGQFFERAKASGYLDDTIFVLVADHVGGSSGTAGDYASYHHIPLAIVAPGVAPGVRDAIGSQTDISPTIMDLAGWSGRYATLGRSLFEDVSADARFALAGHGEMVLWIDRNGWVLHDLVARRAAHVNEALSDDGSGDLDRAERRLLSSVQVLLDALQHNAIYKPGAE